MQNNKYLLIISGLFFMLTVAMDKTPFAQKTEKNISKTSRARKELTDKNKPFKILLKLPWGNGAGMAGRKMEPESNPEGPMSFSITQSGEVFILDQVNRRIQKFNSNGNLVSIIPIPEETFEDIEVTKDGTIFLLDRLVGKKVVVMKVNGSVTGSHSVEGEGIPEGGGVTGMFLYNDGLWLEYNHEYIVHLLEASMKPSRRDIIPGRRLYNGNKSIVANLIGKSGKVLLKILDAGKNVVYENKVIEFGNSLYRISWIQPDIFGNIHVMIHLVQKSKQKTSEIENEKILGFRYDSKLNETGKFESPYTIREWEQFKEFVVTDDGKVFQMAFSDDGVKVIEWRY